MEAQPFYATAETVSVGGRGGPRQLDIESLSCPQHRCLRGRCVLFAYCLLLICLNLRQAARSISSLLYREALLLLIICALTTIFSFVAFAPRPSSPVRLGCRHEGSRDPFEFSFSLLRFWTIILEHFTELLGFKAATLFRSIMCRSAQASWTITPICHRPLAAPTVTFLSRAFYLFDSSPSSQSLTACGFSLYHYFSLGYIHQPVHFDLIFDSFLDPFVGHFAFPILPLSIPSRHDDCSQLRMNRTIERCETGARTVRPAIALSQISISDYLHYQLRTQSGRGLDNDSS